MRTKGRLTLAVLKALGEGVLSTAEVIDVILTSPYGSSYGYLQRRMQKTSNQRMISGEQLGRRREFYDLLSRLKRNGLIAKKESGGNNRWRLTAQGRKVASTLGAYFQKVFPRNQYEKESDNEIKIIAFDIPEAHKRKRWWLRSTIKNLGFTMLQKSVWVGKYKLPQQFIEDLDRTGLLPYVEILAVTKSGSLKAIT